MSNQENNTWDELMGPSKEELQTMLSEPTTTASAPAAPPVRSSGAGAPPPSNMFGGSRRWGSSEPSVEDSALATQRAVHMASEDAALRESLVDADDNIDIAPTKIRQEALRMLQVAEDPASSYKVHRTTTGGYQAERGRMPAALAGLASTARAPFRDNNNRATREDLEYGESDVVDVVGMQKRFPGSPARPGESSNTKSSWSSRYSVDRTLLAMTGGGSKSKTNVGSVLDQMDRENERQRTSARNLLGSAPAKVFGKGFSFRSNSVFGQQSSPENNDMTTNLKAATDAEATLGTPAPAKSWQEQLARQRTQRRRVILGLLLAVVFVVTTSTVAARARRSAAAPHRAISFFVTSRAPLTDKEQHRLDDDLQDSRLEQGSFLVHLGDIQLPSVTQCRDELYQDVANRLEKSPIPTFVLPGNNDWNDCPNPKSALASWRDYFVFYEAQWSFSFDLEREVGREENFSIYQDGVLVIGVFEVGGKILDWDEFQDRSVVNAQWVESRVKLFPDARAVVVLGNTAPGLIQNAVFFDDMREFFKSESRPALYLHAYHGGANTGVVRLESDNLRVAESPDGGDAAPLRVTVGFGDEPFVLG